MSSILVPVCYTSSMGRDKLKRNLQFKPVCREFGSIECKSKDTLHLLHEEIEALYLMDNQGLYQADAAVQMGVSRSTFARIIKNAREKVSMMLITGANLVIEDEKEDYMVLVASMKRNALVLGKPDAPFLILCHINQHKIIEIETLENPVFVEGRRPGQTLPELCNRKKVNFFAVTVIGEGLKSALLSKGVYTIIKKKLTKDDLVHIDVLT